ncbi:hypothetical protein LCGC14_2408100, partial [marine sediment metagenome]
MADVSVETAAQTTINYRMVRAGPVWTDASTGYIFFIDSGVDFFYRKTIDGGATWASAVNIKTATVVKASIWFDKWTTGDAGTKIHLAYTDSDSDDILYRALDTNDDTLSTEVVVFNGAAFESDNFITNILDITKSRGGNLYCAFWGNTAGQVGFYRSTDGGANWTNRASHADGNLVDYILLFPGNETDNNDIWCIYWDISADEISLKTYDNSADSWSETSISTGMTDDPNGHYLQMSGVQRHTDNHVILVAWSAKDTSTADLRVWDITDSGTITAKTDVLTDSAETVQVATFINQQNDDIYVAYLKGGTWQSTVDAFYKKSDDGAGTWGLETAYSADTADDLRAIWAGHSVDSNGGKFQPVFFNDDLDNLFVNTDNAVNIAAAAGGVTVTPSTLALVLSEFAPTVSTPRLVTPPT